MAARSRPGAVLGPAPTPAIPQYEQGRWPGITLQPWTPEASAILERFVSRPLTDREIEAVRRVHLWLDDEGPRPDPDLRASEIVTAVKAQRSLGVDPSDLGD